MIVVVGLSHKSAPLEVREKLAIGKAALPEVLARITQHAAVGEAVVLSTCNRVEVFAAEGDFDTSGLKSTEFEMEWPPRTGEIRRYPEADDAQWMTIRAARRMMLPSQLPILDALEEHLRSTR